MARSKSPEAVGAAAAATGEEIWGTWDDLLLASAVDRHGRRSWDSVAAEVRVRSVASANPESCRQRYRLLHRRFAAGADPEADVDVVPWLEELRKLRVAELRREVERHDLSIVSLQSKVKRLTEEREQSMRGAEDGEGGADLKAGEERKGEGSPGSAALPDARADRVSGGDSGRSCKESNSTDLKGSDGENRRSWEAEEDPKAADPAGKSAGSYDGSSDATTDRRSREPDVSVSVSVSVSESDSKDGEGTKYSSDVQSSAGLPRRRRGRRRNAAPSGAGDPDAATKAPEGSQPFMAFLEIIRSHKCGSAFKSRLESQEGARYSGLIRRHVDLDTVRTRIVRDGGYATSDEFFRDLTLICTNALVYYPPDSLQSIAAVHLRRLLNKEISALQQKKALPRPRPPPPVVPKKEATTSPPSLLPPPPKIKPELENSRPSKPGILPPLAACKKRSSLLAKEALLPKEEKLLLLPKPIVSGTKAPRSNKNRGHKLVAGDGQKTLISSTTTDSKTGPSVAAAADNAAVEAPQPTKPEKKSAAAASGGAATSVAKKRSAAIFLDRINRVSTSPKAASPPPKGVSPPKAAKGERAAEKKKGPGGRPKQESSAATPPPVKRSVGRPPKKAAQSPPLPPPKRARESSPPPPPRKRGRR